MMSGRRGIRFRVTAIAAAAVVVFLVVAGLALVLFQRSALTETIDQALVQRADDLTALLSGQDEASGELPGTAGEGFAQLVGFDGTVLAATPNLSGADPLPLDQLEGNTSIRTVFVLSLDDDPFRVLTRPVEGVGHLHVGTDYEVVSEAAEALTGLLFFLVPILALALATLVWWLVGRTLKPVEEIRSEVSAIGSGQLHRRVPEPGSGDEIDRLAGTMNQMLSRLESAAERQRRFVADASHELRTPLTRIRAALEIDLPRGSSAETTESLREDVVEMQRMTEDLLYLARLDDGASGPKMEPLDLDDLVLEEADRLRSQGRTSVDLSAVSAAHVLGDPSQLRRVVRNLLDNAERHARSRVEVRLAEQNATAILQIHDDGPGIAEEDASRVFERFTRLDDARTAGTGGTGLGLAIAREIARNHGGELSLVSLGTPGATFELRLPRSN